VGQLTSQVGKQLLSWVHDRGAGECIDICLLFSQALWKKWIQSTWLGESKLKHKHKLRCIKRGQVHLLLITIFEEAGTDYLLSSPMAVSPS